MSLSSKTLINVYLIYKMYEYVYIMRKICYPAALQKTASSAQQDCILFCSLIPQVEEVNKKWMIIGLVQNCK